MSKWALCCDCGCESFEFLSETRQYRCLACGKYIHAIDVSDNLILDLKKGGNV